MTLRPAIFLDRDGTLTRDTGYTWRLCDFALLDGVVDGLRHLRALDYALVVVSNQSGVARGYFTVADCEAFNRRLGQELATAGVPLAGIYYCPYHPAGSVPAFARESPWRKPAPGMFLAAARDLGLDLAASYGIGDKRSDVSAATAAGVAGVLVRGGEGDRDPELAIAPRYVAANLRDAAAFIGGDR